MKTRYKILITVVVVAASFAAGRHSKPEVIKVETKIVEVEKKVKDTEKNKNKKTVIVKKELPGGHKETTTTITENTQSSSTTTVDKKTDANSSSETRRGSSRLTISPLIGFNIQNGQPVWGASVSKDLFGPVNMGLWGLSNGTCGVSLGISF
jgi:hypothetical protein